MELSLWQQFCNRLLGRMLKKRARSNKELSDNIVKGKLDIMPEVYIAQTILITLAVFTSLFPSPFSLVRLLGFGLDGWHVTNFTLCRFGYGGSATTATLIGRTDTVLKCRAPALAGKALLGPINLN